MSSRQHRQPQPNTLLLPATTILLIAVALRLLNVMNLPLFIDEVFHIWRAQKIATGAVFTGLDHNKWLYTALLALLSPRTGEALFMGRALTALLSAVTVAGCIALGRLLAGSHAGLLAGAFYALLPLAVLHERQALVDGLLALCATLIVLLSARLARRPHPLYVVLLALVLAAAYLTKATGILFFAAPVAAILLFAARKTWLRAATMVIPAIIVGLLVRAGLVFAAARQGISLRETHSLASSNLLINQISITETLNSARYDLSVVGSHLLAYVGLPLLLLIVASVVLSLRSKQWRSFAYLLLPAVGLWLPLIIVDRPHGGGFPARYLVAHIPMFAVLGALSFTLLFRALRSKRLRNITAALLGLALIFSWLLFDLTLLTNPAEAPLNHIEYRLIFGADPDAAYAADANARAVGEALAQQIAEPGSVTHYLMHSGNIPQIEVYAGPYQVSGELVEQSAWKQEISVRQWVHAGQPVYVLEADQFSVPRRLDAMGVIDSFDMTLVEQLGTEPQQTFNLYLVESFGPGFTERLLGDVMPRRDSLREEITVATATLTADDVVYIHPAYLTQVVSEETQAQVRPATDGTWPVKPDVLASVLANEAGQINLLMVDEATSDPNRVLQTEMLSAYYVGEQWVNFTRLLTYQAEATADMTLLPLDTQFEGSLRLQSAATSASGQPDDTLLIEMNWQANGPIEDSFVVFTHLVDAEGKLITQWDSVPGNGLRPMTDWREAETVTDRYTLPIPAETPAGVYEIRVGVYNPINELRLPITAAPANSLRHGGDYVTLAKLTIESAAEN